MQSTRLSPAVLEAGTEGHYVDAALYDHTYRSRREDQRFYVELARELGARAVLELGVGTGRVALALAKDGREVVGVDRMPDMLERLQSRLSREPRAVRERITLRLGDVRSVRVRRRFPLIVSPFNVFMHLYARRDVERALATCRAHLAPKGRLAFDVLLPDLRSLSRDPARYYKGRPIKDPTSGQRYAYAEAFEYDALVQTQLVTSAFRNLEDPRDTFVRPLAHRQFFPAELEALLHYNGFAIEARYGDFARGPLEAWSESQVVVAKRRR
ncbi:MAG: methyltransferase domain-containing protein [Sandaracinus sp.]